MTSVTPPSEGGPALDEAGLLADDLVSRPEPEQARPRTAPFRVVDRGASAVSRLGAVASGLIVFGMAWLITVDVLGRYLFGRPTQVAFELSGYGLVAMAFLGAAATQRAGRHIEITAVTGFLPQVLRVLLRSLAMALALLFFLWLTSATALLAFQSFNFGAVSVTPLRFPLWIPTALVPLGLGVLAVQLLVDLIVQLNTLRRALAQQGPDARA